MTSEHLFLMDSPVIIAYIFVGVLMGLGNVVCEIRTDILISINDRTLEDVVSNCQKSTAVKCINHCVTYEPRCHAVSYKQSEGRCLLHSTHPLTSSVQLMFSPGFRLYYSEQGECDVGWAKFDGHCYKFNTNLLSWEQAKITCTDLGANLLKVEDATENEFARAKCAEYGAFHYWIGARYYAQYGEYRWYDGTTISYNDWYPGEPDIINGCVDMLDSYDWHWNDHSDCSTSYGGSICEKGLFD